MSYLEDITKKYVEAMGPLFDPEMVELFLTTSQIRAAEVIAKKGDLSSEFTPETAAHFRDQLRSTTPSEEFIYERDKAFRDQFSEYLVRIFPLLSPEQQESIRRLVDEDSNVDLSQIPISNPTQQN